MTTKDVKLEWSERTVVERGIILPWQRVERYGPQNIEGRILFAYRLPKGSVLEAGDVFISYNELWAVAERTIDDYIVGNAIADISYHGQMALEQAGLADAETRGGCHGTQKLRDFLNMSDDD